MAVGWAQDGAVQAQIDASIEDAVNLVRKQIKNTPSATHCDECGNKIPVNRRKAIFGVRHCIDCQHNLEKLKKGLNLSNRKGSKDSQLR